ncbi:MAG: N-acetylmuramic acid 6-phosphate etherase [Pseudomonadota bacterium]
MQTETVSQRFVELDRWESREAVEAMIESQLGAITSIWPIRNKLAAASEAAAARIGSSGRLIYAGAGTSGRIAAQDAVELVPTYGFPEKRIELVIAGGTDALLRSVEGAEDDAEAARRQLGRLDVGENDVVIGVAASGGTPFTLAALEHGRGCGALTVGVSSNPNAPMSEAAEHVLCAETGSEVVAGSTRMKAGTAQKAILNILSTMIMIRDGRVYKGLMVNMVISNDKLRRRGAEIVRQLSGVALGVADQHLEQADLDIPTAVLMARGLEKDHAVALLREHDHNLGRAIESAER